MNEGLISSRYAKMLFELANDKGQLELVRKDIEFISSLIQNIKELDQYLKNPVIRPGLKKETFHSIFEGIQPITFSFLELLIKNNRESILGHIAHRFIQEYKERKGIQQGTLHTAVALSDKIRQVILDKMNKAFKCQIELDCDVDEQLIGGFVFRLEDQQYDASIATQLKHIHQSLLKTQIKQK
jgi:F-type H+-transporting ATPase subunit delta